MRREKVPRVVFSSSGTVYGDVGTTVTHELLGPALPVSLYGAGKVASEALISAFCATCDANPCARQNHTASGEITSG